MGRSKMIAKSCPKCDQQVAVATKSCKCGHTFFSARTRASLVGSGNSSNNSTTGGEERRRTGRVRRARPHFYDSQDYQRQRRKPPKRRSVSQGSLDEEDSRREGSYKDNTKEAGKTTAQRAARRRALKLRIAANEARTPRAPPEPVLDPARLIRCSAMLHEINRKMAAVTWSPDK